MPIHDVLVHVTDMPDGKRCLDAALTLASNNNARVTALYVRPFPAAVPVAPLGGVVPIIDSLIESYRAASERAEEAFRSAAGHAGVQSDWRDDEGDIADCLGFHSRYADVVVAQKSADNPGVDAPSDLAALVAMGSGRPTLSVPFAGNIKMTFDRVMLCWDASRAAHDALSILLTGTSVDVVEIDSEDSQDREPSAGTAAHLASPCLGCVRFYRKRILRF